MIDKLFFVVLILNATGLFRFIAPQVGVSIGQVSRKAEDVFPTLYRCNTPGRLRRTLKRHGFDACVCGHEAEPAYLSFNRIAYWLGTLHAKLAPQSIQLILFGFARKLK